MERSDSLFRHLHLVSCFCSYGCLCAAGLVVILLLSSFSAVQLHAQNITLLPNIGTLAGNGTVGYSGDNGSAISAALAQPLGVVADRAGNIYIADTWNHVIRRVNISGIITTVAGTYMPGGPVSGGYAGDNGPAVSAKLNAPSGVALDRAGNLYIADTANQVIRKVDRNGIITTVAGAFIPGGPNGTGVGGYNGDNIPATTAQLNYPTRVAVDTLGNLYIGDVDNNRIRKVNTSGTLTTVAGGATQGYSGDGGPATAAQLNFPWGVTVDSAGDLYIADYGNHVVRKVDPSGTITTIAGDYSLGAGYSGDGGPATSAQFYRPQDVAVDSAGNLYIADAYINNRIRKVDTTGTIRTVAGSGVPGTGGYGGDGGLATSAKLNGPSGITLDSGGNLFIADTDNSAIREVFNATASFSNIPVGSSNSEMVYLSFNTTMQLSGSPQTTLADFGTPQPVGACDPNISAPTICQWQVPFTPSQPGPRWGAFRITDGSGNTYKFPLAGTGTGSAVAFTPGIINSAAGGGNGGTGLGDGGPAIGAYLDIPWGVAVDSAGNFFISDIGDNLIRKVDATGIITTVAGSGSSGYTGDGGPATQATLSTPYGVAVDVTGNIYIADYSNHVVREVYANTGTIQTVAGTGTGGYNGDNIPATSAQLNYPNGVAVDKFGNLYIADYRNWRIRKVDTNGIISTVVGGGSGCPTQTDAYGDGCPAIDAWLYYTTAVAVDNSENLYISDFFNHLIRKVDANGIITTIAGNGGYGYNTDGIPATSAEITYVNGISADNAGNVYIADSNNYRIRKIDGNGIINTVAGDGTFKGVYFNGDGGLATNGQIDQPEGVAVDGAGNLYISEMSERVRKVTVDTTALAFSNVSLGLTSDAQTVAVSDVGNAPLHFTSINAGSGVQLQNGASACTVGTPVGLGQTCDLNVVFSPISPGTIGTLTLTDDAVFPQVINLSGSGVATPAYSNLTPSQIMPYGTSSVNLSGVISAGSFHPPAGETVTINIGTYFQGATIGANGTFATSFPIPTTPPGTYTITYSYAGDTYFAIANDVSTTLTINPQGSQSYTLTLSEIGTGTGAVTEPSASINCSESNGNPATGNCSANYVAGTTVTLTATPTPPSSFAGWGGACAAFGSGTTCTLTINAPLPVTASFAPPPSSITLPFDPGTNVSQIAQFCPNNSCSDPNAHALTLTIPVVSSSGFPLTVTASEYPADGLCPPNGDGQSSDLDCRLLYKFSFGKDAANNTVVPLCFPYANGNCVHYEVYSGTPGNEPDPNLYSGGVFWKIGFNNSSFVPASYWANSTPRLLDDPDANEVTGLPYGSVCSTPMYVDGEPTNPPIYCQFDRDITTFYNPSFGIDNTIGGTTKQVNDVLVAFLPTTPPDNSPQQPPQRNAPTLTGSCVAGCSSSGNVITFSEGLGGTFALTSTGYPVPTLTESGNLPAGLTFNGITGLISGTLMDGSVGTYPITVTANNGAGSMTVSFTVSVNAVPLTITASSGTMTYGGIVPTITATFNGLVNGDQPSNLGMTCTTKATSASPVGVYQSSCTSTSSRTYTITYVPGTVTVNPADLTITASSSTMAYGGIVPVITASYTGFVNGDSSSSLTVAPTCTTTATRSGAPGTYPSSCSGAVDPDYTMQYVNGTVTISSVLLSPANLNFGTPYLYGVGAQVVVLTNEGTTPLTISSIKIASPGTALSDYGSISLCPPIITVLPAKLPAGKSCAITVGILASAKVFSPTASTATLVITDSAAGSPHSVALSAQVINPQASLSTLALVFPTQRMGTTSAAQSVTITNTGSTPLILGAITISGDFTTASETTCVNGGTVNAGATCVLNVVFTPRAKGMRNGTVKITDNALLSPQVVLLSGSGS